MRLGWHRTLNLLDKIALLRTLEGLHGVRRRKLVAMGIPSSTYYRWQRLYRAQGGDGLQGKRRAPKRIWNRLSAREQQRVLEIARHHPELSSRLLAIKITDEEDFCVSPTTVYRLLKEHGLITPKPLTDMPAAKS